MRSGLIHNAHKDAEAAGTKRSEIERRIAEGEATDAEISAQATVDGVNRSTSNRPSTPSWRR